MLSPQRDLSPDQRLVRRDPVAQHRPIGRDVLHDSAGNSSHVSTPEHHGDGEVERVALVEAFPDRGLLWEVQIPALERGFGERGGGVGDARLLHPLRHAVLGRLLARREHQVALAVVDRRVGPRLLDRGLDCLVLVGDDPRRFALLRCEEPEPLILALRARHAHPERPSGSCRAIHGREDLARGLASLDRTLRGPASLPQRQGVEEDGGGPGVRDQRIEDRLREGIHVGRREVRLGAVSVLDDARPSRQAFRGRLLALLLPCAPVGEVVGVADGVLAGELRRLPEAGPGPKAQERPGDLGLDEGEVAPDPLAGVRRVVVLAVRTRALGLGMEHRRMPDGGGGRDAVGLRAVSREAAKPRLVVEGAPFAAATRDTH